MLEKKDLDKKICKNIFLKKKNLKKKIRKKSLKKKSGKTEKNVHARNVAISTKLGEKLFLLFFCFGCATQNKALGTVKLIKFFFSSKNLWCKFQKNR